MKQETTPLYIRFGEIPTNGKSKVYRGDAIIREEAGVSVWRAIEANGRYYPVLPDEPNKNTIADYFEYVMNCNCNVYLVTGNELCIEGADREPLLEDVKILKDITWCYKRDADIEDADNNTTTNNTNYDKLQSMGLTVRVGHEDCISNDVMVIKLLEFYNHVRHNTKKCSWTAEYPDEEIVRMDLFYPNMIPYIFFRDDTIIGTVMVNCEDLSEITLNRVAVHPDMQGTGFSKLMLDTVLTDMRQYSYMNSKISMYVWEDNVAAQKLYESLGFKKTDQSKEMRGMNFYIYEMRLS